MRKITPVITAMAFLLIIGLLSYKVFFSRVSFSYVYDGTIDLSNSILKDENNQPETNTYIFTSKEQWDNYKKTYLLDGQVPNINYDEEPILLTFTDLKVPEGGTIYDISSIKKNFLSLDIFLKKKGTLNKLKGFSKKSRYGFIMIYKIDSGYLTKLYSPKIIKD